jgi:hypothetical protein
VRITWNLTVMAGAVALGYGLIRGPRWVAYVGGAVAGFYGIVYPNFIDPARPVLNGPTGAQGDGSLTTLRKFVLPKGTGGVIA